MRLVAFLWSVSFALPFTLGGESTAESAGHRGLARPTQSFRRWASPRIVARLGGNRIAVFSAGDGSLLADRDDPSFVST